MVIYLFIYEQLGKEEKGTVAGVDKLTHVVFKLLACIIFNFEYETHSLIVELFWTVAGGR